VAEVGWERGAKAGESAGPGSAFPVDGDAITHQIIDRPAGFDVRPGREYVQPQWVFDSFNVGCLLPVAPYAPGRAPPPHLSPFVDDKAEGYIPRQREILDQFASEVSGKDAQEDGETLAPDTVRAASSQHFGKELQAESEGLWHSEYKKRREENAAEHMAVSAAAEGDPASVDVELKPAYRPTEEEEERLRAKALMPKKHKRLLQRIETADAKRKEASKRLRKKAEVAAV